MKRTLAVVGILSALACASHGQAQSPPIAAEPTRAELAEPAARLLLIGDAGDASGRKHLQHVAAWVDAHAAPTTVVFLGDNFYPQSRGKSGKKISAIFAPQLEVGRAREDVFFVPGNHDWHDKGIGRAHRSRIESLAAYVGAEHWKPAPGAFGPHELTFPHGLFRVIAIDSEQWLMARYVCEDATDAACKPAEVSAAERELEELLACADCPPAVVVAHHPLRTTGEHGGCELTFLRRWVKSSQDLAAKEYRRYVASLSSVLEKRRPLLFAAGHDHSLQVSRDSRFGAHVVSGAAAHSTAVCGAASENWSRSGFMALDFVPGAAPLLRVFAHDAATCGASEFCEVLREPLALAR